MALGEQSKSLTDAKLFLHTIANYDARPTVKRAEEIATGLRNARRFDGLVTFTDQCIAQGYTSNSMWRLNAHGLIECGELAKALCVLTTIRANPEVSGIEFSQATGLMGRAYKQVFLDNQADVGKLYSRAALFTAATLYQEGLDNAKKHREAEPDLVWHGVNVAALGYRARDEGIPLPVDWHAAATAIVEYVENPGHTERATPWNLASAGEAWLALGDAKRASAAFEKYVQDNNPNQNALHSIVRQLRQLWRIKADHSAVGKIYAMVQARLYQVEKGELQLSGDEIAALPSAAEQNRDELERVIGQGGFQIYDTFVTGLTRGSRTIARIGRNAEKGVGTGFLVNGEDFCRNWQGRRVLLTNAHVVTDNRGISGHERALLPEEAIITFTCSGDRRHYKVGELLWTSPCHELDVSVLDLDQQPASDIGHCDIAPVLPPRPGMGGEKPMLFIVGHPGGGKLTVSLNNNDLVDHDGPADGATPPPRVRIHYRTPTEPGNSGSPVFSGDDWRVIGIHHKWSPSFEPLSQAGPSYEANEAIWIQSIRQQTIKLAGKAAPLGSP